MCYPVCVRMHIKEPWLLIRKSSLCGGSRLPLSLSEWSFTISTVYPSSCKLTICALRIFIKDNFFAHCIDVEMTEKIQTPNDTEAVDK